MPIYEYTCRKCSERVEAMQKVTDKPLTRHAGCGGRLEKEWSRTGFQFKGSGWYVTDYAGRKAEAKDASDSGKEAAKSEAKPDAKADAKADAKPAGEKSKGEKKGTKAQAA
jgi:putative FmdB family regulatory protein